MKGVMVLLKKKKWDLRVSAQNSFKICIHQLIFTYSKGGRFDPTDLPAKLLPQARRGKKTKKQMRTDKTDSNKQNVEELG